MEAVRDQSLFEKGGFGMRRTSIVKAIGTLMLIALLGACATTGDEMAAAPDQPLYLANNIHTQVRGDEAKASFSNWTDPGVGHVIAPVNTPVAIESWRRGFIIRDKDSGRRIFFEYDSRRMPMSVDEYLEKITTATPIPLSAFSAKDRKGIADGKAYIGMSRDGVRIALGYPAPHETPSLDSDTWIYWKNRWDKKAVEFGPDGTVRKIVE